MTLTPDELNVLLRLVHITETSEINCDEFLARVSTYLERLVQGNRSPAGFEQVLHHLKICPECREEFEAMLRAHDE
ncbi:MAG: hypothetical protein KC983_08595 [Phycisphaerales bacterium]|nr:hypothetical protein [Phycisphaerales bacterium]